MKQFLIPLLSGMLASLTYSQGRVAQEIGDLIQRGKLDEAQEKVEAYLEKDPHNVDALMMKGNILLNRSPKMKDGIMVVANDNESIYDNSIGFIRGSQPSVLPKDLALQVAGIWQEALKYDNSREDIHFGICQIYSMAILSNELIAYLATLKANIKSDPRLYYSMGDYARNMIERGQFKQAMKVYKAISRLYPEQFGVISDIAGEYYQHGDLDSARVYVRYLLHGSDLDTMSYGNAFFILAVCEDYDAALEALKMKSKVAHDSEYLLYDGLLGFSREQPEWASKLRTFSKSSPDSAKKVFAASLMSLPAKVSENDYLRLESNQLDDAYMILLHRTFTKLLPGEFLPRFNYAEALTHTSSYRKASAEFTELEKSLSPGDKTAIEKLSYYYGWVLWKLDDKESSIVMFSKLLASDNFKYKSAAAYFTGKHYYDLGNHIKANEYFKLVSDRASESKYATLCWNLLRK